MKLLLDENLPDRTVPWILDLYPGSSHVKTCDLIRTDDTVIWTFAQQHGFTIVSKDSDFYQRSLVHGAPPKFIYLRVGNCPVSRITQLLRSEFAVISAFDADPDSAILILS